ncbi:hypothetical protein CEK60_00430 [Halomonas sp. N3-2A]|nr:hypothetical protein CEK60_00430 [Halomonas sp. N3-2A]
MGEARSAIVGGSIPSKGQRKVKGLSVTSEQRDDNRPQFAGSGRPAAGQGPCELCYPVSMDNVLDSANMADAWERVEFNKGVSGPDAHIIEETARSLKVSWPELKEELRTETYQPGPVRTIYISKEKGKYLMLGIPNVVNRLIQQASHQVLSPHDEKNFPPSSFGFRPGRSSWQAIE